MPDTSSILIEPVEDMTRIQEVEDLQVQVWGFEARGVVPAHVLYTVGTSGGILLGAYSGEQLIGFAFGFLGEKDGRLRHVSHMLGIHPDYQGRGIGKALKLRQREMALEQGLDLMSWTFDPLEARNAFFNLHKLGAFSHTYYPNLYGDLGDSLNRGLPTDRLLVEWDLREPRGDVPEGAEAPIPLVEDVGGQPVLHLDQDHRGRGPRDGAVLSVAVPRSIQKLKEDDPEGALAWRLAVRKALMRAFAEGYTARDFRDGAYVLGGTVRDPG